MCGRLYDGGDHTIFVGQAVDLGVSDSELPLLYHSRLWRRSESLDEPTLPPTATIIEVGRATDCKLQEKYVPVDKNWS